VAQDLTRELSDQAEAHHDDLFARCRIQAVYTLKRNRAERGEGRVRIGDAVRYPCDEIRRHEVELRVVGISGARARHTISGSQLSHRFADVDDDTRRTVPERQRSGRPGSYQIDRLAHTDRADLLPNFANEMRIRDRFA
jgi:hypothetical protein